MTRILAVLALVVVSCAPSPPGWQVRGAVAELAGRVAGPPQRCVSISSLQSLRVSDSTRHLLLYGNGRTIWVNPLPPQCSFRIDDLLVTEPTGSFYCRGDIVRSLDRVSRIPGPSCLLGDFVPYTRP